MITQEENQGCAAGSKTQFKQCLNHIHCGGFEGCAIDSVGKIVPGYETKEDLCTTCNHWQELYEKKSDEIISIRVEGHHYQCALSEINKPAPKYAGFRGRRFDVLMKWPTWKFYTCNMWSQGEIPRHFRDKLPDNAEFLNAEKVKFPEGSLYTEAWNVSS